VSERRVVVTGMGIVSPVGSKLEQAWENIREGRSGIRAIPPELFDASEFPVRISGPVAGFDADAYLSSKEQRRMDPFIHYGIGASIDALKDAGLEVTDENRERVGIYIGSGIGGLGTIERNCETLASGGPRRISPFFVPSAIINMVAGNLSIMLGAKGPNLSLVSACATATHSIGDAARLIEHGDADVMIAGGAEAGGTPLGIGGFAAAKALSTRNNEPERASRPWDLERDGFVLGDGAGVLVLEEYEYARRRGARIYCELVGFGMSSDAYHMTQPSPDGEGPARCMLAALRDAGVDVEDVHYVNAHGTSTPAGDKAETDALKRALGEQAYKVPVSSTKSMTGHLLGAAGGIEAIFSVLAIRDQVLPPTINLDNPDPDCDLDYVPGAARDARVDVAVSNSFGFGGTNGTLVFRKL
jgi:3-oxoacyl-[acyl-carrier-protein] synthase II